jgi:hypothetical protein
MGEGAEVAAGVDAAGGAGWSVEEPQPATTDAIAITQNNPSFVFMYQKPLY